MSDHAGAKNSQQPIKAIVLLDDPRLPDTFLQNTHYNAEEIESINILKNTLNNLKAYEFSYLDQHDLYISTLSKDKPALVVNFCDGFNNEASKELHVPALLELLNLPYTGSDPVCLTICNNKHLVGLLAQSLNVPVPNAYYLDPLHDNTNYPIGLKFPLFVKPNMGDGSFELTRSSLVHSEQELRAQICLLRRQYPNISLLIQEFLSGPEFTVGVIGNVGSLEVLPIIEIDYSRLTKDLPSMLPYESKWNPLSPYWHNISFKEAFLSKENYAKISSYAKLLFLHTGCRDYARFDFRMDNNGHIKLLEVNPNPGLNWFTLDDYAGEALLDKILTCACTRLGVHQ